MGYYIEVERGVKLYVEDIGEGIPVLMVHGWPLDHRMYEYQAALLPAYGYRCIQVDLRGSASLIDHGMDTIMIDWRTICWLLCRRFS